MFGAARTPRLAHRTRGAPAAARPVGHAVQDRGNLAARLRIARARRSSRPPPARARAAAVSSRVVPAYRRARGGESALPFPPSTPPAGGETDAAAARAGRRPSAARRSPGRRRCRLPKRLRAVCGWTGRRAAFGRRRAAGGLEQFSELICEVTSSKSVEGHSVLIIGRQAVGRRRAGGRGGGGRTSWRAGEAAVCPVQGGDVGGAVILDWWPPPSPTATAMRAAERAIMASRPLLRFEQRSGLRRARRVTSRCRGRGCGRLGARRLSGLGSQVAGLDLWAVGAPGAASGLGSLVGAARCASRGGARGERAADGGGVRVGAGEAGAREGSVLVVREAGSPSVAERRKAREPARRRAPPRRRPGPARRALGLDQVGEGAAVELHDEDAQLGERLENLVALREEAAAVSVSNAGARTPARAATSRPPTPAPPPPSRAAPRTRRRRRPSR